MPWADNLAIRFGNSESRCIICRAVDTLPRGEPLVHRRERKLAMMEPIVSPIPSVQLYYWWGVRAPSHHVSRHPRESASYTYCEELMGVVRAQVTLIHETHPALPARQKVSLNASKTRHYPPKKEKMSELLGQHRMAS